MSNHAQPSLGPAALSSSPYMIVRETPNAGRSVFATQDIPGGTHLHTSPSPIAFVINREYKREVCGECFAYDRGLTWKLRDTNVGVFWCSEECERAWRVRYDRLGVIEAIAAVESLASKARGWNNGQWDAAMLDIAASKPSEVEIRQAWRAAEEELGQLLVDCRSRNLADGANGIPNPTKAQSKAISAVISKPPAPDILSYLLSAVITANAFPEQWNELLDLHAASVPYATPSVLNQHISAYHQLLALVTPCLLSSVTSEVIVAASSRDAHNSFGIRSLDDGGSEIFGFGVWPSASYWNHSCAPNVTKKRLGRAWIFETRSDVEEGQELCITYLGGDEKELTVLDRKKRLFENWGFDCACVKCVEETTNNGGPG